MSLTNKNNTELTELDFHLSEVAHIGHAAIYVTDMKRSLWFFTDVVGLYVTKETEDRVYLRAWQDWDHHTLILIQSDQSGLDHFGWRVNSEKALLVYEDKLKKQNIEIGRASCREREEKWEVGVSVEMMRRDVDRE